MDIGNFQCKKVIEPLWYDLDSNRINGFNSINQIPSSIKLYHNLNDTLLHYYVGEWLMIVSSLTFIFLDRFYHGQIYSIMFALVALFFMSVPLFRKSMQYRMELTESEFIAAPFRFKWKEIQSIYKIQTTTRYPKYGLKLILTDNSEVNIDLALRKPSFGHNADLFHLIYVFWKRDSRAIQ